MPASLFECGENLLWCDVTQGRWRSGTRKIGGCAWLGRRGEQGRRGHTSYNFGRQFVDCDATVVGKNHCTLKTVLQLPHVAGPAISTQRLERLRVQLRRRR